MAIMDKMSIQIAGEVRSLRQDALATSRRQSALREAIQRSPQGIQQNQAISEGEFRNFLKDNKDLVSQLENIPDAAERLGKTTIRNRGDLQNVLAQAAYDSLSGAGQAGFTLAQFKQNPTMSRLLLGNRDETAPLLLRNQSSLIQGSGPQDLLSEQIAQDVYSALGKQLQSKNPLLDAEFVKNNVAAATYLLAHPSELRELDKSDENFSAAREYKAQVNREDRVATREDWLVNEAVTKTRSGPYDDEFFSKEKDLATLVVASQYSPQTPSLSNWLRDNPRLALTNIAARDGAYTMRELAQNVVAEQSATRLGADSALSKNQLRQENWLSVLVHKDSQAIPYFRSDRVHKILNSDPPSAISPKTMDALRASFRGRFEDGARVSSIVV